MDYIRKTKLTKKETATIRLSLDMISKAFKTIDSYGVYSVSRFTGTNINADAYARTNTFLKRVTSTLKL